MWHISISAKNQNSIIGRNIFGIGLGIDINVIVIRRNSAIYAFYNGSSIVNLLSAIKIPSKIRMCIYYVLFILINNYFFVFIHMKISFLYINLFQAKYIITYFRLKVNTLKRVIL